MGLTTKQQLFADEWMTGAQTGKRFNATAAAKFAGYAMPPSNEAVVGHGVLHNANVQAYIKERMDEISMSAEEVLLRFTDIARANFGDILTIDPATGRIDFDAQEILNNKRFIKGFKFDSNGNPQIEFYDSMTALLQISRIRGMLKDGLEVGGSVVPVKVEVEFVNAPEQPDE